MLLIGIKFAIYFPIGGLKGHGQAELIMLGSLLHTAIDKGMEL